MSNIVQSKREYFRHRFMKQQREAIFKKKRQTFTSSELEEASAESKELNQMYAAIMEPSELFDIVRSLYEQFKQEPEKKRQIFNKLRIISIKLIQKSEEHMNEFFQILKQTFLQYMIDNCTEKVSQQPEGCELVFQFIWIAINLTFADGACQYFVFKCNLFNQILQLINSQFEVLVTNAFFFIRNLIADDNEEIYNYFIEESQLEKYFHSRPYRNSPESIQLAVADCVTTAAKLTHYITTEEIFRKIIEYLTQCLPNKSVQFTFTCIICEENAIYFIRTYPETMETIFKYSVECFNLLNFLSSLSDEVLQELLNIRIFERIENEPSLYPIISNLATYEPALVYIRPLLVNIEQQYFYANQTMKFELAQLLVNYIQECSTYEYTYLLNQGSVKMLVQILQDFHSDKIILDCLKSLICLFEFTLAEFQFNLMGGHAVLQKLQQTDEIIKLVNRLSRKSLLEF